MACGRPRLPCVCIRLPRYSHHIRLLMTIAMNMCRRLCLISSTRRPFLQSTACAVIVARNSILTISEILLSARTRQFCSRFRVPAFPACRLHPTSHPAFTLHQTTSLQEIGAKHRCRLQVFTKILHSNVRPGHWFALYKPCLQQSLSMSQTEHQTSNIKTRPGCRHLRLPYL